MNPYKVKATVGATGGYLLLLEARVPNLEAREQVVRNGSNSTPKHKVSSAGPQNRSAQSDAQRKDGRFGWAETQDALGSGGTAHARPQKGGRLIGHKAL